MYMYRPTLLNCAVNGSCACDETRYGLYQSRLEKKAPVMGKDVLYGTKHGDQGTYLNTFTATVQACVRLDRDRVSRPAQRTCVLRSCALDQH